jgi:hypothetical protein
MAAGLLMSLLLLSWTCSPGPEHEGEPHLGSMYDALGKGLVQLAAWPMVVLFGVGLIVTVVRRDPAVDDPPTTRNDLPRAVASTRKRKRKARRGRAARRGR